jgi:hypothetical protein
MVALALRGRYAAPQGEGCQGTGTIGSPHGEVQSAGEASNHGGG